jgi:16S rRNA (guanine966-N2)-methyltransferase
VRAAIYSIIGGAAVEGARVLDLYAGTGALGIEALSRGAEWTDFVESQQERCRDIRASLKELGLQSQGRVYCARVERSLGMVDGPYDLVLADPPYVMDRWDDLMGRLAGAGLLRDGALVVVEHESRRGLAQGYGGLTRRTNRRYGDTSISIYSSGERDG